MQTWHDGLPTELPDNLALPERPGMRRRNPNEVEPGLIATSDAACYWRPPHGAELPTR